MRQAGIIAAAGIIALEDMVERLAEDHANARRLAQGLARIPSITVHPDRVQTNIVMLELPAGISTSDFIQRLGRQGVKVGSPGGQRVRAVTHRMVEAGDIDEALKRIELVVGEIQAEAH